MFDVNETKRFQILVNYLIIQEKEQRLRFKEKQKHLVRTPSSLLSVGNKHHISDYFNKPLADVKQDSHHLVPLFVEKCVRYIENRGLQNEGLYRIPANTKDRETIIKKFDEDNSYDFSLAEASVHTVAGCLTWFFSYKNLPEPLILPHFHDELEEAVNMPTPSLRNLALRGIVRKFSISNCATFKFLCTHLKKVSEYSSENKMTVENLAMCWYNTLFRPDMDGSNTTISIPKAFYKDVLVNCINQCGFMFYEQQEVSLKE